MYDQQQAIRQIPDIGRYLDLALTSIVQQIRSVAAQTGSNPQGSVAPPSQPTAISVGATSGIFTAAITDTVQTGKMWAIQYDSSPTFSNPVTVDLGSVQVWQANLGSKTLYFRCYGFFTASSPSAFTYFGGPTNPTAVHG